MQRRDSLKSLGIVGVASLLFPGLPQGAQVPAVASGSSKLLQPLAALTASPWRALSQANRRRLYAMQTATHGGQRGRSDALRRLDRYFSFFAPDAKLYGYTEPSAVSVSQAKGSYEALFLASDGMLVSDEMIVAGPMAAQRYHVLSRFDGAFFGRQFNDDFIALRGQDIFEMDAGSTARIAKRWANHDHAYRVSQMPAPGQTPQAAAAEGAKLGQWLNGPLDEARIYEWIDRFQTTFNDLRGVRSVASLARDRTETLAAHFVAGCPLDGGAAATVEAHLRRWFVLMPDVTLVIEGRVGVANFGAFRWRATGRLATEGDARLGVDSVAVTQTGETIFRFTNEGLVDHVWTHHHAPATVQNGALVSGA